MFDFDFVYFKNVYFVMKINLGKSQHKKSYFPISFDSSTTANFGEVLPFFSYEAVPDSHLKLDLGQGVRFSPLSFPTFGKAFLKSYLTSNKISDLYPPFENLLSQTPYTSYDGTTYIPSEVPSLPLYLLWLCVYTNCSFNLYTGIGNVSSTQNTGFVFPTDTMFYRSSFAFTKIAQTSITSMFQTDQQVNLKSSLSASLIVWLLFSLSRNPLSNRLPNFSGEINTDDLINYVSTISSYDEISSRLKQGVYSSLYDSDLDIGSCDLIFPLNLDNPSQGTAYLPGLSFNSTNLKFYRTQAFAVEDLPSDIGTPTGNLMFVGIRLNNSGKLLRKILMGLGYHLTPSTKEVSILPLYSYFKSYFELFAPKRFVRFEQSFFARAINYVVNTGNPLFSAFFDLNSGFFGMSDIIDDLLSCFYTKDTDYYSAQIVGMINDYGGDLTQKYIGVDNTLTPTLDTTKSAVSSNADPSLNFDNMQHTQAQQNILSRLTQFVNRRSVVGAKLSSLLKSVFGISPKEVDEYNTYIGSHTIDVEISDVFSTAETQEGSLGEFAGKAVASGRSDSFNLDTDIHSIVVGLFTLIPRTQYVNGINPLLFHKNASDFYNPMFDGLTLLPTSKLSLFAPNGMVVTPSVDENSFGNLPLYSEYKTKTQGILSGDLSLQSTRASFDSFTMDEVISPYSIVTTDENDVTTISTIDYNIFNFVNGTMWRYLGRWLWLGRFDRIFQNNRYGYDDFLNDIFGAGVSNKGIYSQFRDYGRSDDNLVIHSIVDLSINAPMVPLSGSFMTQDMSDLFNDGITSQSE